MIMSSIPTKAKENYLKALFHLHLKRKEISVSELGQYLNLSKPTVNDMVKKLHQDGWVKYQKYKPMKLTSKGIKNAALVIRKHRLAEMFLSQIMGFGWEEVHDIAEEVEHLRSQKLFDRMDEILGFPTVDPHGSPIPNKNGDLVKHNYKTLADQVANTKVVLKALRDSSNQFLTFLNKKELLLGTEIFVHHLEPFDQSMTISYGNYSKQNISNSVSMRLLVGSD